MQKDLLILHGPPQPFDENVVSPGPAAVHAEPAAPVFHCLDGLVRGKLAALVGVDDLGCAVSGERLLQNSDRVAGLQGDGNSSSQHLSAGPVQYRGQVDESPGHGDIGRVKGPHLVGSVDG